MSILAVDLGGSHIGCALVKDGIVLESSTIETDAGSLRDLLPEVGARLRGHCRSAGITPSACEGMGVGFPGVVDYRKGEILSTLGKFDDMTAAQMKVWCRQEFELPFRIENDAKLALLGEHFAGAAKGFADVVMVTLGTGIGGAVMLDNHLLWSEMGQGGSLGGHLTVRMGGRRCVCGAVGCAEAEASTSVLPAIASAWPGFERSLLAQETPLDFAAVFRSKDAGDPVGREVLDHCIAVWSALAVTLIHAYGPQLVLFGGGVMKRGKEILQPVRAYVEEHGWKTSRGLTRIEAAVLGTQAALVGAEALFGRGSI
jgi:glucokinase